MSPIFDSFSTHSCTYLSIGVICFAGPPLCFPNKGCLQFDVRNHRAHLGYPDVSQLQILVSTFGIHCGAVVKLSPWPFFTNGAHSPASDVKPLQRAPILPQKP